MTGGEWELASSIVTVILGLGAVARWIYLSVARPLHRLAELLQGDEGRPGLLRWQAEVDQHLGRQDLHLVEQDQRMRDIEDELHPNGGSSTYDDLTARLDAIATQVGAPLPPTRKPHRRRGGS